MPEGVTPQFLDWFRERTEATWMAYTSRRYEDYVAAGVGGADWQRDTRWLGGLTDEQIAAVEGRWSLRFPPDYRLFLQRLHSVDRPLRGAFFTDPVDSTRLVPAERPSFYNWFSDADAIQSRLAWLWEGLQFDVEHNSLWPASWGPKPATLGAQKQRVRELVETAPKLIPVFGHRYLLADPCVAGNPVFSVYQSDIIVYGADLRVYLLREFAAPLGLDRRGVERETGAAVQRRYAEFTAVPFWGELLEL